MRAKIGILTVAALTLGLGATNARADEHSTLPPVGLFTTMPIYWGETEELGELLRPEASSHWVRKMIEEKHEAILPLDVLDPGSAELAQLRLLLMAQPRALAPAENVALDAWVRGGGHLLMFADPWLEEPSRFPLGDPRRSHPAALVSPILARWGLSLQFDDQQQEGLRQVSIDGQLVPVDMAGRFSFMPPSGGGQAACTLKAEGVVADCRIGDGRALIVADADLLRTDMVQPAATQSLKALMEKAFPLGDFAGLSPENSRFHPDSGELGVADP